MLRPLSLEAMRKEHHEAAQAAPLVFGTADELIDDHLGRIDEVAELRFPENEPVGPVETVAVFESEDASFGERAADDLDPSLVGGQIRKQRMRVAVLRVEENRVPLTER